MNRDEQTSWFSHRTPSHLVGFVYAGCPELGLGDGGHGEQIAVGYRLRCTCGNQLFAVTAYLWNSISSISPIRATCSACHQEITIFDANQHGYNPIACEISADLHGERDDKTANNSIATSPNPQTVDIVAYYPDDLFNEEFDEFADKRNDLFTWLRIIVGENTKPGYPPLDFECA